MTQTEAVFISNGQWLPGLIPCDPDRGCLITNGRWLLGLISVVQGEAVFTKGWWSLGLIPEVPGVTTVSCPLCL